MSGARDVNLGCSPPGSQTQSPMTEAVCQCMGEKTRRTGACTMGAASFNTGEVLRCTFVYDWYWNGTVLLRLYSAEFKLGLDVVVDLLSGTVLETEPIKDG